MIVYHCGTGKVNQDEELQLKNCLDGCRALVGGGLRG